MRLRRSVVAGAMLSLAAAMVGTAGAVGTGTSPVAPNDPYADCTIGASGTSVSAPNTQVEPWVAVDPNNPKRVIAGWQQDRWSASGGSRGLVSASSSDGRHFTSQPLPFSRCAPGGLPYERASDVWFSFGPDGTAYASGLNFDVSDANNGVGAATSYDGGRTWKHVTQLIAETDPAIADDKNSVTADPDHAGTAYQVWDRITQTSTNYDGPSVISITRDRGRTWSTPKTFVDTSAVPFSQTIGNQIIPDARRHVLYNFFEWQTFTDASGTTPADLHFAVVKSTDEGRTWSKPVTVAKDTSVVELDPNTPNDPSHELRAGNNLVSAGIDPVTGELYAVYEGSDFSGGAYDQIEIVHSTDGGATWSAPARISQAPNSPAFTPAITVDKHGVVGVVYYDLRYLQPGNTTTLPTAAFLVTFPRGGQARPAERQISPVFDWLKAPFASWGHFLGDYDGLAMLRTGQFRPLFSQVIGDSVNSTNTVSGVFGPGVGAAAPTATAMVPHPVTKAPARRGHWLTR